MRILGALIAALAGLWVAVLPVAVRADPRAPTTGECTVCHASPDIVNVSGPRPVPGLLVTDDRLNASVHADLSCTDCHSPLTNTLHPKNDRAATSCADCHSPEAGAVAAGAHGTPSALGPSPTCATCHTAHDVVPAAAPGFDEGVAARCAACHTRMSTHAFGSNPMGMETHLGRVDVATCDDCHEAHAVRPASDPASSVSPQHKLETCRRCHTNAPPNFRDIQIHVANGPLPGDLRLGIATLWMLGILIFTFAFFGWLTLLGIRHDWRQTQPSPEAER